MAISDIDLGGSPNDGTGSTLRAGGAIVNLILDMWNTVTGGIAYVGGKVGIGTSVLEGAIVTIGSKVGGEASVKGDVLINQTSDVEGETGGLEIKVSAVGAGYGKRVKGVFDGSDDYDFHFQTRKASATWSTNMILKGSGVLNVMYTPVYANNAAALVGGLVAGDIYKTASTGDAIVMITNAT